MLTLHVLEASDRGLEDATLSIGILDPHPPGDVLRVYDFGLAKLIDVGQRQVLAVAEGDPARVSFSPELHVGASAPQRMAANRAKVLALRRRRGAPPTDFVTGYETYARGAAEYWREHGVGSQPALAAGVFALSSIQTPIMTALRLFSMLTPHVVLDALPPRSELTEIVAASGAGLGDPERGRPAWYIGYEAFRSQLVEAIAGGERDDRLRRMLALDVGLPRGLGLAKLSFVLALLGNDCGCLDARIVGWAFTRSTADAFLHRIATKRKNGTFTDTTYQAYRSAELRILRVAPFYDPADPLALARAQWMLWESLGPEAERTHTHEQLFRAVVQGDLELPRA